MIMEKIKRRNIKKTNINEISKEYHQFFKAKGFFDNPRELGTLLMLIVSELGEALEADRCGRYADMKAFESCLDDGASELEKIEAFKMYVKDTLEDEIADTLIRLFDLCGYMGIDIDRHIKYKMWYNSTRPNLHGKAY